MGVGSDGRRGAVAVWVVLALAFLAAEAEMAHMGSPGGNSQPRATKAQKQAQLMNMKPGWGFPDLQRMMDHHGWEFEELAVAHGQFHDPDDPDHHEAGQWFLDYLCKKEDEAKAVNSTTGMLSNYRKIIQIFHGNESQTTIELQWGLWKYSLHAWRVRGREGRVYDAIREGFDDYLCGTIGRPLEEIQDTPEFPEDYRYPEVESDLRRVRQVLKTPYECIVEKKLKARGFASHCLELLVQQADEVRKMALAEAHPAIAYWEYILILLLLLGTAAFTYGFYIARAAIGPTEEEKAMIAGSDEYEAAKCNQRAKVADGKNRNSGQADPDELRSAYCPSTAGCVVSCELECMDQQAAIPGRGGGYVCKEASVETCSQMYHKLERMFYCAHTGVCVVSCDEECDKFKDPTGTGVAVAHADLYPFFGNEVPGKFRARNKITQSCIDTTKYCLRPKGIDFKKAMVMDVVETSLEFGEDFVVTAVCPPGSKKMNVQGGSPDSCIQSCEKPGLPYKFNTCCEPALCRDAFAQNKGQVGKVVMDTLKDPVEFEKNFLKGPGALEAFHDTNHDFQKRAEEKNDAYVAAFPDASQKWSPAPPGQTNRWWNKQGSPDDVKKTGFRFLPAVDDPIHKHHCKIPDGFAGKLTALPALPASSDAVNFRWETAFDSNFCWNPLPVVNPQAKELITYKNCHGKRTMDHCVPQCKETYFVDKAPCVIELVCVNGQFDTKCKDKVTAQSLKCKICGNTVNGEYQCPEGRYKTKVSLKVSLTLSPTQQLWHAEGLSMDPDKAHTGSKCNGKMPFDSQTCEDCETEEAGYPRLDAYTSDTPLAWTCATGHFKRGKRCDGTGDSDTQACQACLSQPNCEKAGGECMEDTGFPAKGLGKLQPSDLQQDPQYSPDKRPGIWLKCTKAEDEYYVDDGRVKPCGTCTDGNFVKEVCKPGGVSTQGKATKCEPCDTTCPDGQYVKEVCKPGGVSTQGKDTECHPCKCPDGQFIATPCKAGDSKNKGEEPQCKSCTPCTPSQTESRACGTDHDRQCSDR